MTMRRGPAKKPPATTKVYETVYCRSCHRTLHKTPSGGMPYHVKDPSQWRGTWCQRGFRAT